MPIWTFIINIYIPNPLSACTPVNISKCSIQAKIDMIKFLTDLDNKRFGILFNLSCYWSDSSFPYDFLYLIDQSFLHLFEWLQTNRQICCLTDTFIILKQSYYIHWNFFLPPFSFANSVVFLSAQSVHQADPSTLYKIRKPTCPQKKKKKSPLSPDFLYCGKK